MNTALTCFIIMKGSAAAEASARHNTSKKTQDVFRQKEQANQLGSRRMREMFGRRWVSMDVETRQPTHCLRKLSERIMAARRISEEVIPPAGHVTPHVGHPARWAVCGGAAQVLSNSWTRLALALQLSADVWRACRDLPCAETVICMLELT